MRYERSAPKKDFGKNKCACGCGLRKTNPRRKYFPGHSQYRAERPERRHANRWTAADFVRPAQQSAMEKQQCQQQS